MSSWHRFGKLFGQTSAPHLGQRYSAAFVGTQGGAASGLQQVRRASGGHHGHEVTYEGLTLHEPAKWHSRVGTAFASVMWFWIFVRAYHDGSTLMFGHATHFEHEAHGDHQGSKNSEGH